MNSGGYNLVEKPGPGFNTQTTDILSQSANLLPLANNGGPTFTCAIGCNSPALDAGDPSSTVLFDQRYLPRPYGTAIDIGAYEFLGSSASVSIQGPTTACLFDCIELFSSVSPAGGSYEWSLSNYPGAPVISTGPTAFFEALQFPTEVTLTYTDQYGCEFSAVHILTNPSSCTYSGPSCMSKSHFEEEETVSEPKISLIPNPAGNHAFVHLEEFDFSTGRLNASIFDSQGKLFGTQELMGNETQLDITHLPSGIYLLRVSGNGVLQTIRFVKQ